MIVVALIAGAAIAHAIWNVTLKRAGSEGISFLWPAFIVGVIIFAPVGIVSLQGVDLLRWLPLALVSGVLQVGYFLLLQYAYRVGDVSVVYPLARGSGPLLTVVFAIVLLHERPSPIALLGAAIVIAGVVVIGLAGGGTRSGSGAVNDLPDDSRVTSPVDRAGVIFGLLVGVVIAAYTLWDAAAVTVGGMPPAGLYWGSIVFQLLLCTPAAVRRWTQTRQVARRNWRAVLIVGILSPLAYILVLQAIQLAPVSIVAPAREVSVVLVGLAGWLLLREPHPVQRMLGAAVVLVGVTLLAIS